MNCKVCGTRLGILERWRYGDFCSQEHKTVFADDLESLDRQLSSDAEPPPKRSVALPEAATQPAAGPQPEAEPVPVMADFIRQADPKAQKPVRLEEKLVSKPPSERTEKAGELWKLLAKKAEQDALPAPARAGAWAQERPVIIISAPNENQQGPGGYYLAAGYPTQAPPGQVLSAVGHFPRGGLAGVNENFWGPAFAVGMPIVPSQPKHWVDNQGWHWISDPSAQMVPTVENVLATYPMVAPWTQWPLMAPGMAAHQAAALRQQTAEMNYTNSASGAQGESVGQQMGGGSGAPQSQRSQGQTHGTGGGVATNGPGSGAPGAGMPGAGLPGAGQPGAGLPGAGGPMMGGPGFGGLGFGGLGFGWPGSGGQGTGGVVGAAGGIFGGGQVLAWGGGQPMAGGPLPQGGPGFQWREVPPPFFSALVDLSHGIHPLASPAEVALPCLESQNWPDRSPACPSPQWALQAELALGPTESVMTKISRCPMSQPLEFVAHASWTIWHTGLPRSQGLMRPRVPRRAAPPVLLPLGGRLGLAKPAEPMMSTGSGMTGSRGA